MDEAISQQRVATVRGRTSFASQVVTVIAVAVPPIGLFAAMGLLWGVAFHWYDLVLLAGFYVICAFGTTIGFHRYFTHKGFDARTPVKASLAILGCLTMQGPLTQWVTDHRKHHALSDKDGDPHSPHVGHGDGCSARSTASSTPTSAGSSRSRGWSADGSTARTCTRIASSGRSTACTCSGSCSRSGSRSRSDTRSAERGRPVSRAWSGEGSCGSSSTSTPRSA